jgi:hypothetical protein
MQARSRERGRRWAGRGARGAGRGGASAAAACGSREGEGGLDRGGGGETRCALLATVGGEAGSSAQPRSTSTTSPMCGSRLCTYSGRLSVESSGASAVLMPASSSPSSTLWAHAIRSGLRAGGAGG